MSNDVALQVHPSVGEYHCKWRIPFGLGRGDQCEKIPSTTGEKSQHAEGKDEMRSFSGTIELKPDREARGTLIGWMPAQTFHPVTAEMQFALPQTYKLSALHGSIQDTSFEVLLLDVTIYLWDEGRADIFAAAALTGMNLPLSLDDEEEINFFGAKVQVTNLDAICGYTPLAKTRFPNDPRVREAAVAEPEPAVELQGSGAPQLGQWGAIAGSNIVQSWSDDEVELTLGFHPRPTVFDPYYFSVGFTSLVEVECSTALNLREWIDRWADPIKKIVSVATGKEEVITHLELYRSIKKERESGDRICVWGTRITQDPFSSRVRSVNKAGSCLFIPQDHSSLLGLIRSWCGQLDDHNPVLETYNPAMLRGSQHPRSRYLMLVQCLEGLYGYQTRDKSKTKLKEHRAKRKDVIKRLKALIENNEVEFDEVDLKFIKDELSTRPTQSLTTALEILFSQVDAEKLLATLKSTKLISEVDKEHNFKDNVGDCIRQVRNDLSHGNRGYSATDLEVVVKILHRIVRAQILRSLGTSERSQERVLDANQ